jgi:hypothetical protein
MAKGNSRGGSTMAASRTVQILIAAVSFMIFYVSSTASYAATLYARSASYGDVAEAISSAKAGDTVVVPAGTGTWNNQLTITKSIILQGAGIDRTTIKWGSVQTADNYLIQYNPVDQPSDAPFRISGFTIDGDNKGGCIRVVGTSTRVRIHHNKIMNAPQINNISFRGIYLKGRVWGVIDNNQIINCFKSIDSYGQQKSSWDNYTYLYGTADNIYYEDNLISTYSSVHSGGQGGRYAARYNTYYVYHKDGLGQQSLFDMHGNQGNDSNYATMGAEKYGNKVINYHNLRSDQRGGKSLHFYNDVTLMSSGGKWTVFYGNNVREEFADCNDRTAHNNCGTGGTFSGSKDGQPMRVSDSYYWVNHVNGKNTSTGIITNAKWENGLAGNVDFWNYSSSFSGSSGMGCGSLVNRPANCTAGVAYWATNQSCSDLTGMVGANPSTPISGTLYKCTSTNKWTAYYTPYTYPHPLRAGGILESPNHGDEEAVSPPQGLGIIKK